MIFAKDLKLSAITGSLICHALWKAITLVLNVSLCLPCVFESYSLMWWQVLSIFFLLLITINDVRILAFQTILVHLYKYINIQILFSGSLSVILLCFCSVSQFGRGKLYQKDIASKYFWIYENICKSKWFFFSFVVL